MKIIFFLTVNLLILPMISQAVLVKLPSKPELTKRLLENGHMHLIEKTNIIERLAGQEQTPLSVHLSVQSVMNDYCKELNASPLVTLIMNDMTPHIVKLILEDSKEAVAEFEILQGELEKLWVTHQNLLSSKLK